MAHFSPFSVLNDHRRTSLPGWSGLAFCALLTLGGCSGGSSTSGNADGGVSSDGLSIYVSKGPITGAECAVFDASGNQMTPFFSADKGQVRLPTVNQSGLIVADCKGGSYQDEATGQIRNLPTTSRLHGALNYQGGKAAIVVTPLTEMAYRTSKADLSDYPMRLAQTAKLLGLGIENDYTRVLPTDVNQTTSSTDAAGQYGAWLASFSQLLQSKPTTYSSVEASISYLVSKVSRGALDSSTKTELLQAMKAAMTANAGRQIPASLLADEGMLPSRLSNPIDASISSVSPIDDIRTNAPVIFSLSGRNLYAGLSGKLNGKACAAIEITDQNRAMLRCTSPSTAGLFDLVIVDLDATSPISGGTRQINVSNGKVFAIGGEVVLTNGTTALGSGLVIREENTSQTVAITQAGPFRFPFMLAENSEYALSIASQPIGQSCSIVAGMANGLVDASVPAITVSCSDTFFSIKGNIRGLSSEGLKVLCQGCDSPEISLASGSSSFEFTRVKKASQYQISIVSPTSQSCSLDTNSENTGKLLMNVMNLSITCATRSFQLAANVGLQAGASSLGTGLKLVVNDDLDNALTPTSTGSFVFPKRLADGTAISIHMSTPPAGQRCNDVSGVIQGRDLTLDVTCEPAFYKLSGTVSGLVGPITISDGLGSPTSFVVSADGSFGFQNGASYLPYNTNYSVTIIQSTGQSCTVQRGAGIALGDVTNISIVCSANRYRLAGLVSGLSDKLVLSDGAETPTSVTVQANGSFNFSSGSYLAYNSGYAVSVISQPKGQFCTVSNNSGTVTNDVSNITVSCIDVYYSISGAISGLTDSGLVISCGSFCGVSDLTPASGATSFVFSRIRRDAVYALSLGLLSTQTCTLNSNAVNSGTLTSNVNSLSITCASLGFNVLARITAPSGTLRSGLKLSVSGNTSNILQPTSTGTFAFPNKVADGASVSLDIVNPTGQSCSASSGVISGADLTLNVNCFTAYQLGGTIAGLVSNGLVLGCGSCGVDDVSIDANSTTFQFANIKANTNYRLEIVSSPAGQTCSINNANPQGILNSDTTSLAVVCSPNGYKVAANLNVPVGKSGLGVVFTPNRDASNQIVSDVARGTTSFTTRKIANGVTVTLRASNLPGNLTCPDTTGTISASDLVINITCQ